MRSRRAARSRIAAVRRAPAARRPLHALLIALGLLIAQGPVLLHLLLVQHVTCEHGELVEVQRASNSGQRAEAARADGRASLSDATANQRGHEHCDALAMRHRQPEVAQALPAPSLDWVLVPFVDGARAERRSVPILSLAPKGSPPAA